MTIDEQFAYAMGTPRRIFLCRLLRDGPTTPSALQSLYGAGQTDMSRQLKEMRMAGAAEMQVNGRFHLYSLTAGRLGRAIRAALAALDGEGQ